MLFVKKDEHFEEDKQTLSSAISKIELYEEKARKASNKGLAGIYRQKAEELNSLVEIISRRTKL